MGLVEALLSLGVIVVVPAGLRLHPDVGTKFTPAIVGAAVAAALSLQYEASRSAVVLAIPWVAVTTFTAARAAWRWLTLRRTAASILWPAAAAYLAVGAVWLLLDRAGVEPVGVRRPFVLLTAVHFHYAGFTATLLAALTAVRTAAASRRLSIVMAAAVVAAPPIVAAGFTFAGPLQIVGAVVLTIGLFLLSWLTLRVIVGETSDRLGKGLLIVSSLAVVVPMLLAVQWAVGWNYATPALSIPAMARTHGVVNAVGFGLCGVCGWLRLGYVAARQGDSDD